MSRDLDSPTEGALEGMAYLSRSENRIRILDTLSAGARSPRGLTEQIDLSRSSLRRILTELIEHGWAERALDGEYRLTRTGEQVATETTRYIRAMQAIQALGDAISWLPADELTVGIEYFRTATVIGPQRNEAVAPDSYAIDCLERARAFRNLVNIAPTVGFERALHERVADGRLTAEHVVTRGVLSRLREDSARLRRWRDYLESGATMHCYDGTVPCNLFLMDETAFIASTDLEGLEYLEVENETVVSWAESLYETYRRDAERVTPDTLRPG